MGNHYTTWERNVVTYQIFFEKHIRVFIEIDHQDALSPYVDIIALKHRWQRHLVVMVVQELDCLCPKWISPKGDKDSSSYLKIISAVGRFEISKSMEGFQTLTSSH